MKMKFNNEKTDWEKEKIQLRRKTMTVTKLTIIALSAAAIMFSGCSTDNRIAGPGFDNNPEIDNNLLELSSIPGNPNTVAKTTVGDDTDRQSERFTIVAKVVMLDVENGCWYLITDEDKTYTPVAPKELVLEPGLRLKAEGYIDYGIQFFCGNGPAFVIENYEILDAPKDSDNDRDSGIRTGNGSSDSVTDDGSFSEDRDPSRQSEERAPEDEMDAEREMKKKSEEEQDLKDKSNDRP